MVPTAHLEVHLGRNHDQWRRQHDLRRQRYILPRQHQWRPKLHQIRLSFQDLVRLNDGFERQSTDTKEQIVERTWLLERWGVDMVSTSC